MFSISKFFAKPDIKATDDEKKHNDADINEISHNLAAL